MEAIDAEGSDPVRVWIEDDEGAIARGLVERVSMDGAEVRITGAALLESDHAVSVRIAFTRSSPTVAARARVVSVRTTDDAVECALAWIDGAAQAPLAALVASLA